MAILGARLSKRFYASRIIQVGFIVAVIGLGIMGASIQLEATPQDLILGGLFGAGIGLIVSQILNLILSSVSAKDTAETAGLTSTFEQLGNAIGVALIGTVMLSALVVDLQTSIVSSTVIPDETKQPLNEVVEEGVQLMSNSQLQSGLEAAGLSEAQIAEINALYQSARTNAFRAGVGLMIYGSLLGLVISLWLPKRRLVGEDTAVADPPPVPG